jgi:hypothetical protein
MTKAQYARHRGVSAPYISKLRAAGRLVFTADGKKILVAESDALIEKTRVRDRFLTERATRAIEDRLLDQALDDELAGEPLPADTARGDALGDARLESLRESAALARLKRLELEGRLVDASDVRKLAFERARAARKAFESLPDRLAGLLAVETQPNRVHEILMEEFRKICDELAQGVIPGEH